MALLFGRPDAVEEVPEGRHVHRQQSGAGDQPGDGVEAGCRVAGGCGLAVVHERSGVAAQEAGQRGSAPSAHRAGPGFPSILKPTNLAPRPSPLNAGLGGGGAYKSTFIRTSWTVAAALPRRGGRVVGWLGR